MRHTPLDSPRLTSGQNALVAEVACEASHATHERPWFRTPTPQEFTFDESVAKTEFEKVPMMAGAIRALETLLAEEKGEWAPAHRARVEKTLGDLRARKGKG